MTWVAGLDGCRTGWVAALMRLDGGEPPRVRVVARVEEIADAPEAPAVIAVDIPIGLPERIEGAGRTPEQRLRRVLGPRASSVFSMPARAAVERAGEPDGYAAVCREARARSDPPRAISRQGFHILPKVREVDALLRARPELRERVFEVHPEAAFWALNGGVPLPTRKAERAGLVERRTLLVEAGLPPAVLDAPAPRGAKADDLLDALCALVAARAIAQGEAQSFPDPPERDALGIPVAIWAPKTRTPR